LGRPKLCQTDLNYTFLSGVGTRKLLEVKPNHVPSVTKTIRQKKMHTENYEYPFLWDYYANVLCKYILDMLRKQMKPRIIKKKMKPSD
jgi:hypothetical protein